MPCTVVNRSSQPIPRSSIPRVIQRAGRITATSRSAGSVNVVLVDDAEIRKLNARHLGLDRATDVLSFNYRSVGEKTPGSNVLGEIIIAVPQLVRQAKRRRLPVADELHRLLIHGYLHLLGHDHHKLTDRRIMRQLEKRILTAVPGGR